eukprot:CAMPEP_0114575830 /NCGR_PEP_ID=MMETSP0125-20121206/652_1 /TAXON_ID=485358 ORGANISM="Aristerostoma sp., Strain ATCC 50986" /NCGR_SAMPLE_ID=MMETSP0125 /ASSEMBLY_ACC=CAM_ASM_000245 /LENGTH=38 /DNA_ID= /DNA_START= /DNA_END= /DNA_ORIENTATION=
MSSNIVEDGDYSSPTEEEGEAIQTGRNSKAKTQKSDLK